MYVFHWMRQCLDCRYCHLASLLLQGCQWDTSLTLHPMMSSDTTWFVLPIHICHSLHNFYTCSAGFYTGTLYMDCSITCCCHHLPSVSSNWVGIVHPDVFDNSCCSFTNNFSESIFKIEVGKNSSYIVKIT